MHFVFRLRGWRASEPAWALLCVAPSVSVSLAPKALSLKKREKSQVSQAVRVKYRSNKRAISLSELLKDW